MKMDFIFFEESWNIDKINDMKISYDCHGKTHDEVIDELENWLILHHSETPFDIITGNSNEMKKIVMQQLDELDFKYGVPADNNGMIKVF